MGRKDKAKQAAQTFANPLPSPAEDAPAPVESPEIAVVPEVTVTPDITVREAVTIKQPDIVIHNPASPLPTQANAIDVDKLIADLDATLVSERDNVLTLRSRRLGVEASVNLKDREKWRTRSSVVASFRYMGF